MSYIYYCRCEIIHVRNLKIIYIKKLLDICHSEYNKEAVDTKSVSYTHLTLPTILRV